MKTCFALEKFLWASLVIMAVIGHSDAELEQKNRRGGTYGLHAFPRVGRSDPSLAAANSLHDADQLTFENMYPMSLEDYEEYPKSEIKRESWVAFPRVGRNDAEMRKWARLLALQQALEKRTGPSAASGMWFGPRLGKRSVDDSDFNTATVKGQKENF